MTLPIEGYRSRSFFFLDNNTAVVAFIVRVGSASLAQVGHGGELPLRLHVLVIDITYSRILESREWPVASYVVHVIPAASQNLAIVMPDKLFLYSSTLQIKGGMVLPAKSSPYQYLYESPGAKFLIVAYERDNIIPGPPLDEYLRSLPSSLTGKEHLDRMSAYVETHTRMDCELIDLRGLHVVRKWADPGMERHGQITDDGTMLVENKSGAIEAVTAGGVTHVLCPALYNRTGCANSGMFVSNNVMFNGLVSLGIGGFAMSLGQTDGKLVFERELPEKQSVWGIATSTGQRRFAIAINRGRGGSDLLDIGPHISLYRVFVYDLLHRRWIFALDAKKEGIKGISGLALSPDGSRLALINQDGILETFRLPSQGEPAPIKEP